MHYLLYEQIHLSEQNIMIYESICLNDDEIQNENFLMIDYE